ncbi:MAG: hypothetical protein Q4D89_05195 [Arachnia propionica]|uniref:hypothetical protein n=1 Tax=Arachnia propionica TaxID=1750 RepID=UPI0026FB57D0|nr:hypothetical protein [Arachnia propionica]
MINDIRTAELGGVATSPVADTTPLVARSYTHPMMDGRTVVRLVREPLTEAEDIALAVHGLAASVSAPVGHVRAQAIGFPAWPILHDPTNAHHALRLLSELRRAAHLAASTPGTAKSIVDFSAGQLDRSVPHFLPTFFEEAARIFLDHGNRSYAASYFSKAREAERVHSLPIDEDRHRHAFREFALAGLLTAKEFTAESKSLQQRLAPSAALPRFLHINLDRARGGLPPYPGLASDLNRLATAADADPRQVSEQLLEELLRTPSISQAPQAFWESFREPLIALATCSPQVRRRLFQLTPGRVDSAMWVSLLEDTGVAEEMRTMNLDPVGWIQRFITRESCRHRPDLPVKLSRFIRALPRQDGRSIDLRTPTGGLHPELLDAACSLGLTVQLNGRSGPGDHINFTAWLNDSRRSDLTHLANSSLAPTAARGLAAMQLKQHLPTLLAYEGSRQLLRLSAEPQLTVDSTVDDLARELNRLKPLYTSLRCREVDEGFNRLEALADPAELTARAIRAGFLTELTWPTLEEAAAELGEGRRLGFHESWPWCGVAMGDRIIWVRGDEREDVLLPTAPDLQRRLWFKVGRDTVCIGEDRNHKGHLRWASDPTTDRPHPRVWDFPRLRISVETPEGRLLGDGLLRPGDSRLPISTLRTMMQEGNSFWSVGPRGMIREVDAGTGRLGRASLPPTMATLIEQDLREGFRLCADGSWWLPDPGSGDSPLGSSRGQLGWVVLRRGATTRVRGVDGYVHDHRPHPDTAPRSDTPVARLARPGGGHWLVTGRTLCAEDSRSRLQHARDLTGDLHLLHDVPLTGWHHLRPRDPAVSARMRTIRAEEVSDLIAALPAWTRYRPDQLPREVIAAAEKLLGSTDPALTVAVGWAAVEISREVHTLHQIRQLREATRPDDSAGSFTDWVPSNHTIGWLVGASQVDNAPSRTDVQLLRSHLAGTPVPDAAIPHVSWAPAMTPELYLAGACRPLAGPEIIRAAVAAVGVIRDSGLFRPGAALFTIPSVAGFSGITTGQVTETDTGPAVIIGHGWRNEGRCLLFLSPGGGVPPTVEDRPTTLRMRLSNQIDAVVAAFEVLLEEGGPGWDPSAAERFAAATGWCLPGAKVFLAGMPNLHEDGSTWLPDDVRKLLGLSTTEVAEAKAFLKALDPCLLAELVSAGAADPTRMVRQGLDVDAMAERWQTLTGGRVTFPGDILLAAERSFHNGARSVAGLAGDDLHPYDLGRWLWVITRVRLEDPLRPWLADRLDALTDSCTRRQYRSRSRRSRWLADEDPERLRLGLPPLAELPIGATVEVGPWRIIREDKDDEVIFDAARVEDWHLELDRAMVMKRSYYSLHTVVQVAALAAGQFAPLQEWLRTPGQGWAQDPLASVPDIVAETRTILDLPEDAARYWLQLLALPHPTDRNIHAWNGWRKSHREQAAAPLLERGLVLEAKRARAGRSLFLPGGWSDAKAPLIPMEEWKYSFLREAHEGIIGSRGGGEVVLIPLPQLFSHAWQRHQGGDVPGYVELRTERTRR